MAAGEGWVATYMNSIPDVNSIGVAFRDWSWSCGYAPKDILRLIPSLLWLPLPLSSFLLSCTPRQYRWQTTERSREVIFSPVKCTLLRWHKAAWHRLSLWSLRQPWRFELLYSEQHFFCSKFLLSSRSICPLLLCSPATQLRDTERTLFIGICYPSSCGSLKTTDS